MAHELAIPVTRHPNPQHWLVALFMIACFAAAWWMTPHKTWFENIGSPKFEALIPKQFGEWIANNDGSGSYIVDPQQQDAQNDVYTEIVSRIYLHKPTGRRIMLSLAYGDNQTFSKQLHRPESCYSSQGFKIEHLQEEQLQVAGRPVNVMRMTASIGRRLEQATYFIRVGDKVISGPPTALNIARMLMGLKGYVADGLLFRVSEVNEDVKASNPLHNQFINDLLHALSPTQQVALIGRT